MTPLEVTAGRGRVRRAAELATAAGFARSVLVAYRSGWGAVLSRLALLTGGACSGTAYSRPGSRPRKTRATS
jgi:hypothetical protein